MKTGRDWRATTAALLTLAVIITGAGCGPSGSPTSGPPTRAAAVTSAAATPDQSTTAAAMTDSAQGTETVDQAGQAPAARTEISATKIEAREHQPPPEPAAGRQVGENHVTDEMTDMPGRPVNQEGVKEAIAALSPEERNCLPHDVRDGHVSLSLDSVVGTRHARVLRAAADCVDDDGIVRLMIVPGIEEELDLTEAEEDCLAAGNSGRMVRRALETEGEYPAFTDAIFIAVAGTFINAQDCLGPERSGQMDASPGDVAALRCIVQDAKSAESLVAAIVDDDEAVLATMEERARECARQFLPQHLIEPPECGRDGMDPDIPCWEP